MGDSVVSATVYESANHHWRVSVISIDGKQRVRVEYYRPQVPGLGVPVQHDGKHRCGPHFTRFGVLVADAPNVAEVERYVQLERLEKV